MVSRKDIDKTLEKMILSASGWRGVFAADCDEESKTDKIPESFRIICGAAALIFAKYLGNSPLVLIGIDTRPTGDSITKVMIPVLLSCGCDVRYAGIAAAPEIMAWAGSMGNKTAGFIYISASHNPIGYNGLKFGLTDGGVLAAEEANKIIADFTAFIKNDNCIQKIESLISSADPFRLEKVYIEAERAKTECYKSYYDFCGKVVNYSQSDDGFLISAFLKNSLSDNPLGIVCDFNGSARTVSIDKEFFTDIGFKFECINDKPGQIVHRIVPEGESLEPCARLLEKVHKHDSSFLLGYVPDCDGDRGNLVILEQSGKDNMAGKARPLEAQEVFALACVAELSHFIWIQNLTGDGNVPVKTAVAINDPTSMRVDRIAEAFGASVFRAEVGEANVVSLARKLREEGYHVRILGEGSAGGNITHPSAVRDPINTVLAIAKMLSVRSVGGKPGLFEIWCSYSGQMDKYRENFTLADIINSLPLFVSTPAYNKDAIMHINTPDHTMLKDKYQEVFLQEWEERKDELKKRFGFYRWEAIAYNGIIEKRELKRFGDAGKGGLKILFFGDEKSAKAGEIAYIWMRGSATEPVFRIMADVSGDDASIEQWLLDWQRCMIMKADNKADKY